MFEPIKQKIKDRLGVPSQPWSLNNIKSIGFKPKVIYDIGAYQGSWTAEVIQIFPGASYYLFEGQSSKKNQLEALKNQFPDRVNYQIGLLGAENGKKVIFNEYETASSVFTEYFDTGAKQHEESLIMLDTVIKNNNWQKPDLIKLDTQGYELEILKGSPVMMEHAEVILSEVSFIEIYKGAPLVNDVINFMDSHNFQLYDICSLMRRPLDKALFQADVLFVKKTSALLASKKWNE